MLRMRVTLIALVVLTAIACRDRRSQPAATLHPISSFEVGKPPEPQRLLRGFEADSGGWRWTARQFAVSLDPPQTAGAPAYFEMDFHVPPETGQTVLTARANGIELCRNPYKAPGRYRLTCPVPTNAMGTGPAQIEIDSSGMFRDSGTGTERALIVLAVGLKEYEATAEFQARQADRPNAAMKRVDDVWKPVPAATIRNMSRWVYQSDAYLNNRFFGVQIAKIPVDLWMMQQILYETKPDYIVETGTWKGGSALYFAWLLATMHLPAKILTVDIVDVHRAAATHPLWKEHVEFFRGSSTDPALVRKLADRVKGRKVLVTLDSDHSMLHVLHELNMYAPMVNSGGYLLCEDTHLDGVPTYPDHTTGPMAAVERFLDTHPDFQRDLTREVAPTFNPGAWLKRK